MRSGKSNHEFIETWDKGHLMFWFDSKSKKEKFLLEYSSKKISYSLITSVSIRRLPGDGEHIVVFLFRNE